MKKAVVIGLVVILLFSVLGSAMYDWRIFVSDAKTDGYFRPYGVGSADIICQQEAEDAGITDEYTKFVALISTSKKDAIEIAGYGGFENKNGDVIAESRNILFSKNVKAVPNYRADNTKFSGYVWTGSTYDGKIIDNFGRFSNCNDWTSNIGYRYGPPSYGYKGSIGYIHDVIDEDQWLENTDGRITCDQRLSFYCIEVPVGCVDSDNDGYYTNTESDFSWVTRKYCGTEEDCNDYNDKIYPFALETCDGIDNNCDGDIDDGLLSVKYQDFDNDGYGNENIFITSCFNEKDGIPYTSNDGAFDCDELNVFINPGQEEICNNGIDDNCNGLEDEGGICDCGYCGLGKRCFNGQCVSCTDSDRDGYYSKTGCGTLMDCDDSDSSSNWDDADGDNFNTCNYNKDCDDNNPEINPSVSIDLCDGLDNDCDGQIDEDVKIKWYADGDTDGFYTKIKYSCTKPGLIYRSEGMPGDCDDDDSDTYPDATEICDGIDNDCDGEVDEGLGGYYYPDMDGDGFGVQGGMFSCGAKSGYVDNNFDCDDLDPFKNPIITEKCDGIDNDCDGQIDNGLRVMTLYQDFDGDGIGNKNISIRYCNRTKDNIKYEPDWGVWDCNDGNAAVSPNLDEDCRDELDNDCDGYVNNGCTEELCDDFIDNNPMVDNRTNEGCCGNGELDLGELCDGDIKRSSIDIFDCTNGDCYSIYESEGLGQWSNTENVNACYIYSDKINTDSFNYVKGYGNLHCGNNCGYMTAAKCEVSYCGNGEVEEDEECDTKGFGSISCSSLNGDYVSGLLKCDSDCKYDISSCKLVTCGNGKLDKGEDCDAGDLNSESCGTQGYTEGSLSCNSNNCKFDYSSCKSVCGNGVKEIGEVCDGSDIVGKTCVASNYAKGVVECSVGCDKFEYSKCDKIFCGDGICSRGESTYCDADCAINKPAEMVKRSSVNVCGDGKLGIYEQCDEELLGGMDCVDFEFTSGVLDCNDECGFDISNCDYEGMGESESREEISDVIKKLNTAIIEAKAQSKDTTKAEALLLEAIKDYASGEEHTVVSEKLSNVEILLEGGEIQEESDLPFEYVFGVVILGLVLMLVFVLRGLGGREDEAPKEENQTQEQ
jgi:hypothetical protein